jgi:hypothetical protein
MPEIRLFKSVERNCWLAQFVDDLRVLEIFGTDTIPTAFTALADFETVRKAVQNRNPNRLVVAR